MTEREPVRDLAEPDGGIEVSVVMPCLSSLLILCGYQAVLFALFAKTFAVNEGFLPADPVLDRFFRVMYLERGLAFAAVALVAGGVLLLAAADAWRRVGFGPLDADVSMTGTEESRFRTRERRLAAHAWSVSSL